MIYFLAILIGIFAGASSAFFLKTLDLITQMRISNPYLIYFLPLSGILVVFLYKYFGKNSEAGNNLLLEEIHNPKNHLPLRMAPLILFNTLWCHLFGASVGREGTAVQMSGALSDQVNKFFNLSADRRKLILMAGMSAGFSSVFGTPLAGTIFGLEVLTIGKIKTQGLLVCFVASIAGHLTCLAFGINHESYKIDFVPILNLQNLALACAAGVIFGLMARFFVSTSHRIHATFNKVKFLYLRPVLGGLLIVALYLILGTDRYLGLGTETIVESFKQKLPVDDFIFKTLFTTISLGSGFKGGEVTPLFFIGSTLGNSLSHILNLPMDLMAAMGFVAVFSGASNTPITSSLLALELFGAPSGIYTMTACLLSYIVSGHKSIYSSQKVETRKDHL